METVTVLKTKWLGLNVQNDDEDRNMETRKCPRPIENICFQVSDGLMFKVT